MTPFLRIPLSWYTSETYSLYPDETPTTIRRSTASSSPTFTLRHFCGYCGTPLSLWRESPVREGDFINTTLGSLWGRDVRALEEMGVLPGCDEERGDSEEDEDVEIFAPGVTGQDWFHRMVEGSPLARAVAKQHPTTRLPHYNRITPQTSKPRITVEWEIMEWSSDDEDAGATTTTAAATTTTTTTTYLQIQSPTTTRAPTKRKISEITTEGAGATTIREVEMMEGVL
ncbi:hypothetical protein FGG08_002661 [Glutinoglossum americanum]|uniref:CENP-V/GFA domain-containing protein n=1 Tax=Glutinoglossum americanum TaxID=1670608 RepID=A0A9P8I479_9PEZI|nr:hypothetical protein FGG08_002661 [Glutinoglossum americanum]